MLDSTNDVKETSDCCDRLEKLLDKLIKER